MGHMTRTLARAMRSARAAYWCSLIAKYPGATTRQLGKRAGVSAATVSRHLRGAGLKARTHVTWAQALQRCAKRVRGAS